MRGRQGTRLESRRFPSSIFVLFLSTFFHLDWPELGIADGTGITAWACYRAGQHKHILHTFVHNTIHLESVYLHRSLRLFLPYAQCRSGFLQLRQAVLHLKEAFLYLSPSLIVQPGPLTMPKRPMAQ